MFYDIFLELCSEKGVTPAQVRKDLSISQSTMASWKSRGLNPNASTMIQLSDYFDTTPAYLLGNRMAKKPMKKEITFNTIPDFPDLEQKFREGILTPEELQQYKKLVAAATANTHKAVSIAKERLRSYADTLNAAGQVKVYTHAADYAKELAEIPKYQREKLKDTPDTPSDEPQEDTKDK